MVSQNYLNECFMYNSETGELIWKNRPIDHFKSLHSCNRLNSACAGKKAGGLVKGWGETKYQVINLDGKKFKAHRIIWKMINGVDPEEIDHINGNGLDNRVVNLRDVTRSGNGKNKKIQVSNSSGLSGVYWHKSNQYWCAQIGSEGKRIFLGGFEDKFEAYCSRKSAEGRYGFHANHGRPANERKATS